MPPLPSAGVLLYRRTNDTADADNVEVLIEDGGSGGRSAGPVAAAFLRGLDAAQN